MVAAPSDIVLTEGFTYSGMVALSAQNGYRLHGVDGDADGLLPDALDALSPRPARRSLYAMPSLQTPTAR